MGFTRTLRDENSYSLEIIDGLYYASFVLYLIAYYVEKTTVTRVLFISVNTFIDVIRLIAVLALIVKLVLQKFEPKMLIIAGLIGLLTIAVFLVTREWNLILLYFFIITSRDVSIKKMAKCALLVDTAILLALVSLAILGIIPTVERYRAVGGIVIIRTSLGFSHPNQFGQCVMAICCAYSISRFAKFKYYDLIIYIFGAYLCDTYAGSRTAVACIVIIVFMSIVSTCIKNQRQEKLVTSICLLGIIILAGMSLYLMAKYNPMIGWMRRLDYTLSGRFQLAHYYYQAYPPKALGRPLHTLVYSSPTFIQNGPDNAYVRLLLQDGIVATVIIMIVYIFTVVKFVKLGVFNECVFGLFIYAIVAVMEANSLHFAANYCLAGCSCLIFGWEQYHSYNLTVTEMRLAESELNDTY